MGEYRNDWMVEAILTSLLEEMNGTVTVIGDGLARAQVRSLTFLTDTRRLEGKHLIGIG